MEPKSLQAGPDYAEGLINKMRTVIRRDPHQGNKVPGTAQPASLGHRLQQTLRGGFHREPSRPDSSFARGATALVANRSPFFLIAVVLMAALAVSLSLWLSGVLVQAQSAQTVVEYLENSTDEVATFSASDPEGATPITWSLVSAIETPAQMVGGVDLGDADIADFDDFKIDDRTGVLEFKSPPNFEDPDGGQLENVEEDPGNGSNTYKIVVQATDGDTGTAPEDTRSWFKVTVNVTDLEEEGKITLRPATQTLTTLLQPQVFVGITAANLMDGDGVEQTPATTYQWYRADDTVEEGAAISGATLPAYTPVHLSGGASDIGKHLRVVATYTDGRGAGKTATAVSMYPTLRAITDNQPPTFREGDATTRGVRETDEKGVKIGAAVTATDPEGAGDEKLTYWLSGNNADMFSIDADTGQLRTKDELNREADDGDEHEVTVNVTDSSGDATNNQDTITVTIEVLEFDEKPRVMGQSTIELMENETDLHATDAAAAAGDNDVYTASDPEEGTITLSLSGDDKDLFKLSDLGVPAVVGSKVLAFKAKPDFENPMDDNGDNVYEVTVEATDDANTGMKAVTVKVTNMQEDGEVKVMPAQPRIGIEVTADLTDSDVVAYGPMWQWYKGATTAATATEPAACTGGDEVEEDGWSKIGGATSATYTPRSGDLNYCLRAVAEYNDGFHEGVATTTAPIGIYADPAIRFDKTAMKALSAVQYPSENLPPEFATATTKRFVPENAAAGNDVGEPVTADDPNGAHTVTGYTLSGTDADSFKINAATGQLITGKKFNYETKKDRPYTVTVTATDTEGETDSIKVDIYVVDVDEGANGTGATMAENTVSYCEEGEEAADAICDATWPESVLTLTASDPDGATPITWSLVTAVETPDAQTVGGIDLIEADIIDHEDFKIDPRSGVLEFRSPPSFEKRDGGQEDTDEGSDGSNTYKIVVQATDGDTGAAPDTRSWFKVTVNVADDEEEGKITLRPTDQTLTTLLQPQADVEITAAGLMDGDGVEQTPATTYQWYRADDTVEEGAAISGATLPAYTPVHLQGGVGDIGKHLRVVATYSDGRGAGKTATAVSMYPTLRAITDNQPPTFTEGDATTRGVRETDEKGVKIGAAVTATDPEGAGDEKLTYWLSGNNADMFSIDADTGQLRTKDELNREADDGDEHEVTVNVTDSSGDATNNQDTITVTIEVLEFDEKPRVMGQSTIELMENETDLHATDAAAAAGDNDVYTASDPEEGTITLSLSGDDKDLFKLSDLGVPAVVGSKVLAFKAKPDFENPMDDNGDNVYEVTVEASDDANTGIKAVTVKVTNMQEDGEVKVMPAQPRIGIEVTADLTDSDVVAYGPMWQWYKGATTAATATEPAACTGGDEVEEDGWSKIGGATSATYTPRSGDLNYCLRAVAEYNDGFHEGVATTTAPIGIYADPAIRFDKTAMKALSAVQYPSENLPPEFATATTKRFVPENAAAGNDVGEPVTADDPNGAHTVTGYALSGTDADSFDIDGHTGQLITGKKFNYETKKDRPYTVTVTATDTEGETDSIKVDIYVVDVDEKSMTGVGGLSIRGSRAVRYAENRMDQVGTYTADGADAAGARWSLSGDDMGDFRIGATTGVLTFRATPNYEAPADADGNNAYQVTVNASSGDYSATLAVTVRVTDEDEGTNAAPEFAGATTTRTVEENTAAGQAIGAPVTATDPENDSITYTISGADAASFGINGSSGQLMTSAALDFEGARSSYTVVVTATDAGGQSDTITVTINVTDVELSAIGEQFDADNNEEIERSELVAAVRAYQPPRTITRAELVQLVRMFQRSQASSN